MRLIFRAFTGLILFILTGAVSFSQSPSIGGRGKKSDLIPGSLSGFITDDKLNQPLPGATISVPDLQLSTVADEKGHYHFKLLPGGRFLIAVSYVGFKTFTRFVDINGPTEENFKLKDEAVEGSAVVVMGNSKATQIKMNPVPIVAVSHNY